MNHRQYREWKKKQLLQEIQLQRLELTCNKARWLEKTEYIDRSWQTFSSSSKYLAIASGIIALYAIRHPSALFYWSSRVFKTWSVFRLLQKTLSSKSFPFSF